MFVLSLHTRTATRASTPLEHQLSWLADVCVCPREGGGGAVTCPTGWTAPAHPYLSQHLTVSYLAKVHANKVKPKKPPKPTTKPPSWNVGWRCLLTMDCTGWTWKTAAFDYCVLLIVFSTDALKASVYVCICVLYMLNLSVIFKKVVSPLLSRHCFNSLILKDSSHF